VSCQGCARVTLAGSAPTAPNAKLGRTVLTADVRTGLSSASVTVVLEAATATFPCAKWDATPPVATVTPQRHAVANPAGKAKIVRNVCPIGTARMGTAQTHGSATANLDILGQRAVTQRI